MSVSILRTGTILLNVLAATAMAADRPSPPAASTASSKSAGNRLREGTEIVDELGAFRVSGDRVSFFPASSGVELRLLENLALERVVRALNETREPREWLVCGRITEYRGANFLYLTRAVAKSR